MHLNYTCSGTIFLFLFFMKVPHLFRLKLQIYKIRNTLNCLNITYLNREIKKAVYVTPLNESTKLVIYAVDRCRVVNVEIKECKEDRIKLKNLSDFATNHW